MPTQAISAYGIQLRLSDGVPLSALTINAATNTTPILVTTTAPHGIVDVSVVTITGVLGNLGANGTFIVQQTSTTQLRLRGSVGTGAYTSGGSLVRTGTFATIAEVTNLRDIGLMATLVETSAHDGNGYASRIPTFLNGNTLGVDINLIPTNAAHNATTGLEFLSVNRIKRDWLVVFPDPLKWVARYTGYVVQHRTAAPVAGVLTSAINIEMDGAPLLAAP
jgi:hypothetical protein